MNKMYKVLTLGVLAIALGTGAVAFAAPAAATATNLKTPYPTSKQVLPARPVVPTAKDNKTKAKYIAAVQAYMKAVVEYENKTSNDAKLILTERNAAITSANQTIKEYKTYFGIKN